MSDHEHAYLICENKCLVEGVPKETYDESISDINSEMETKANALHTHTIDEITDFNDNAILNKVYPVGSVYISWQNVSPASFLGGSWAQLSDGYWLRASTSGGGGTVSAGLPNLKGYVQSANAYYWSTDGKLFNMTNSINCGEYWGTSRTHNSRASFNASAYNSIYSDSVNTVQPPSYKVYMWRRTE